MPTARMKPSVNRGRQTSMVQIIKTKKIALILTVVLLVAYGAERVFAEGSPSASYVPLIGISFVPEPLALPKGPGKVTYHYAVKNFLNEYPLANIQVTDNKCSPVKFIEGDDNGDGRLDYTETWRFACAIKLSETTQSIATAIGTANNLPAAHKAYSTVVVGSDKAAPLVNIINITKIAYPLTLPEEGGDITFTYRVNNPGVVPVSDVSVIDDKCSAMSGKLGDTNGNNLLDIQEVWLYTCTTHLNNTTTNTVSVTSYANELKAVGYATLTVTVATHTASAVPHLPNMGTNADLKHIVWEILGGFLGVLIIVLLKTQKGKSLKKKK